MICSSALGASVTLLYLFICAARCGPRRRDRHAHAHIRLWSHVCALACPLEGRREKRKGRKREEESFFHHRWTISIRMSCLLLFRGTQRPLRCLARLDAEAIYSDSREAAGGRRRRLKYSMNHRFVVVLLNSPTFKKKLFYISQGNSLSFSCNIKTTTTWFEALLYISTEQCTQHI